MNGKTQRKEMNDAKEYDKLSSGYMEFIYPPTATQILEDTKVSEGTCIEIGSGPGFLAMELAKQSKLKLFAIEISLDMIAIAQKNIEREKLEGRINVIEGDVHSLPCPNNFADIIVSRDSLHHWRVPVTAFKEIHRVLKPSGLAYILDLRKDAPKDIVDRFEEFLKDTSAGFQEEINSSYTMEEAERMLKEAGIQNYEVRLWRMSELNIIKNIKFLMRSPVKDSRASELSQVITFKKGIDGRKGVK